MPTPAVTEGTSLLPSDHSDLDRRLRELEDQVRGVNFRAIEAHLVHHDPRVPTADGNHPAVENRLLNLEDSIASLVDPALIEAAITKRVADHIQGLEARVSDRVLEQLRKEPRPSPLARIPLVGDVWWDLTQAWSMCWDWTYQISWLCRLFPPAAFIYILGWPYFAPVRSTLTDLHNLGVAYLAFRVLGRELKRYHQKKTRG
jgi:hypothetical protein